ncbi:MAG: MMPL family transporter [Limimaricola sp.]|uniref:efflux RND transporter permease subunit n=1 Tax=Limimaricola sp. TaxID=2211665 RepID=UPI001D3A20B6|nr:efflux RND transporter permease subunit [Limimaricola sp.]MBI1417253.1 MMPL family transporter [Limimaricola sp.]
MNFSAWSIRNPIAPILAFVMFLFLGWQAFNNLPITRFPNIDVPLVAVSVTQAGAAPAELETQVTKEIEDTIAGISGVKNINSTITDGSSTTVAEFRMEVPTDKAVQDVKDAIDRIRGTLPGDVDAPVVTRIDVEGQAIMTFAVSSPNMSLEQLSWFVDDTVTRALQGQSGIGRIDRYGGADREIAVALDPAKLDSFGISAAAVSAQLRATNTNLGAGRSQIASGEQAIRILGDASTVASLASTTIGLPSGRFVKLSDLGTVTDSYKELRSFSRFNGNQVVTFGVFRAKGASEVSVAEKVNATLTTIRAQHPEVKITPVDDTVYYTYGNYEAALHTLMEGALLAVIVVLLFLRNWRATLIAAVALPLSAIPTFWIMDLLGFSLNLVSFLALTLATGILVDDAIVEIENISRHIRMGKTPYRAAIEAADEIGLAVIATTLTIVAVFVPVSFMPGIPGQYFSQFGLTVAISVIFSLLTARLITPMMAAYLMRAKDAHEEHEKDGLILRSYSRLVRGTMRFRYLTLLAAVGVLIVSLFFLSKVPGSFIPPDDVSRISVSAELPPGSTLADTDRATQQMQQQIAKLPGVENIFVLGGASPTGDLDIRRATVTVLLEKLDHRLIYKLSTLGRQIPLIGALVPKVESQGRTIPQSVIEGQVFKIVSEIPDVRASKLNDRGQRDISFSILSNNEADLNAAAAALEAKLRGDPLLANVAAEGALPRPEVQIVPRKDEMARLGITTQALATTIRVATIGDFDAALAKVSLDNRLIPIRVKLTDGIKDDVARLGAIRINTASGGTVPLNAVADINITQGPSTIDRLNRERLATIGANLPPGVALGTATARFNELTSQVKLPPDVHIASSGDAEVQQELVASFGNAMIMGLLLVLTVLILLFGSVIQPFTILFSLPLAIGGVAAGLILTNNALSMPVLIGILMLMGIVTKNAILLVDFAVEMRKQGMDRFAAMVEAGRKRARPIVMTSIAMSAGMFPSALGVGEGGSFRAPMAIAVIGGIIVSTVLSLIVVPSFFIIMDDLSWLLGKIFGRIVGKKEEEPKAPEPEALAATLETAKSEIDQLRVRLNLLESGKGGGLPARHAAE